MPEERRTARLRHDGSTSDAVVVPTDLTHVLLRRWYLVLTGLLITLAMISAVLILLPLKYNARADVLLWTVPTGRADNPLLDLAGLQNVPVILARSIPNTPAADALAREGATTSFSVTTDPTTSAPLLIAQATGTTPQGASRALRLVVKLVPRALDEIQQDLPARALITYKVLQYDQPTAITRTRTRILLAATAASLVLSGLLATATDRLIVYRRRNRKHEMAVDTDTAIDYASDETAEIPAVRSVPAAPPIPAEPVVASEPSVPAARVPRPRPAPTNGTHPASRQNRPSPKSAIGARDRSDTMTDPNSHIQLFPIRDLPGRHAHERD